MTNKQIKKLKAELSESSVGILIEMGFSVGLIMAGFILTAIFWGVFKWF
ncbi:MAG: hypothetical protein HZA78_08580 [Candidatus Schekmanbacteria bacterium]|nr:hypothetical protein [Candidatus Schekmanbacteria bacterium]